MLALISYITGKVFADAAVPVWTIGPVEELFDGLANVLLLICFIDGLVDLLFNMVFHFLVHFADDPLDITFSHF